jgi:hypothetical protein
LGRYTPNSIDFESVPNLLRIFGDSCPNLWRFFSESHPRLCPLLCSFPKSVHKIQPLDYIFPRNVHTVLGFSKKRPLIMQVELLPLRFFQKTSMQMICPYRPGKVPSLPAMLATTKPSGRHRLGWVPRLPAMLATTKPSGRHRPVRVARLPAMLATTKPSGRYRPGRVPRLSAMLAITKLSGLHRPGRVPRLSAMLAITKPSGWHRPGKGFQECPPYWLSPSHPGCIVPAGLQAPVHTGYFHAVRAAWPCGIKSASCSLEPHIKTLSLKDRSPKRTGYLGFSKALNFLTDKVLEKIPCTQCLEPLFMWL